MQALFGLEQKRAPWRAACRPRRVGPGLCTGPSAGAQPPPYGTRDGPRLALNWFKRLAAPPGWQHMTLQRIRQRLLFVPAQLVRPAGTPTLRIMPSGLNRGILEGEAVLSRVRTMLR
jgi:hypothetical protein